jgi:hypothetical protein
MSGLRRVAIAPVLDVLLSAGGLQPADAGAAPPPEKVVIHDSRTSPPPVDIATVRLDASWYWDSEQGVTVTVPNGFRAGHELTVYFDLNGDSTPDGHYNLRLIEPKKKGGKYLRKDQEFRMGGGWDVDGGKGARCSGSEGPPVAGDVRVGERTVFIGLDLWWCLKTPNPADSGSWRAAVRLAKGNKADMAPNGRKWSAPVAGWGPCDPSGGECP